MVIWDLNPPLTDTAKGMYHLCSQAQGAERILCTQIFLLLLAYLDAFWENDECQERERFHSRNVSFWQFLSLPLRHQFARDYSSAKTSQAQGLKFTFNQDASTYICLMKIISREEISIIPLRAYDYGYTLVQYTSANSDNWSGMMFFIVNVGQ